MATERTAMTPFGTVVHVSENKDRMTPWGFVVNVDDLAAVAAGAIMNQLQGSNMGADLYNGTLL